MFEHLVFVMIKQNNGRVERYNYLNNIQQQMIAGGVRKNNPSKGRIRTGRRYLSKGKVSD